jgi:hypothetical protein
MVYNKQELLTLPAEERLALAEGLWSSVEENIMPITDYDILFAEERLKMHFTDPEEGVSIEVLKKYFSEQYGF